MKMKLGELELKIISETEVQVKHLITGKPGCSVNHMTPFRGKDALLDAREYLERWMKESAKTIRAE